MYFVSTTEHKICIWCQHSIPTRSKYVQEHRRTPCCTINTSQTRENHGMSSPFLFDHDQQCQQPPKKKYQKAGCRSSASSDPMMQHPKPPESRIKALLVDVGMLATTTMLPSVAHCCQEHQTRTPPMHQSMEDSSLRWMGLPFRVRLNYMN
jgi:hypothetical protein